MESTDIEVLGTADVEPVTYSDLEKVLFKGDQVEVPDVTEQSAGIVRRIMEAKTAEDVLAETAVVHARDMLDTPIRVMSVHWNRSDIEGGLPIYAVMDCVDEDGQPFVVTCGGIRVMAQVSRLAELGALPALVRILESERPTAQGFRPLRLVAG